MIGGKHKKFPGSGQQESYMPSTKKGYTNKRKRKDCEYYVISEKYCTKIRNLCVGPTICRQFMHREQQNGNESRATVRERLKKGTIVHSQYLGNGIVSSLDGDLCTIEFKGIKIQRRIEDILRDFKLE